MSERAASSGAGEVSLGRRTGAATGILPLFAATLFLSALLLFWVQPMAARMVLPLLGGSSAVWTTSMVFFQVCLLAGYAFAHVSIRVLGARAQALLHVILVLFAVMALPFALDPDLAPPNDSMPVFWLLAMLTGMVGLPFFALSATAPALQAWFARTGHPDGRDPYFLYGVSNLGSLLALLGFPLVLEPLLPVGEQASLWASGYVILVLLIGLCMLVLMHRTARGAGPEPVVADAAVKPPDRAGEVTWTRRLHWMALAFVPSSLMLGVTSHLSTDVAAAPLLWVLPLSLYLLTFVLVFARRPPVPHAAMVRLQPYVIGLLVVAFWLPMPIKVTLPCLLFAFFALAMVCHGELAARRPPAARLTEFYLWMSIGGALGGGFNAVVAPLVFNAIYEFPLAIVAACLLCPRGPTAPRAGRRWLVPALMSLLAGTVLLSSLGVLPLTGYPKYEALAALLTVVLIVISLRRRPLAYGLGLAIAIVLPMALKSGADVVAAERSFYGVIRVKLDRSGEYMKLTHGTTLHGAQAIDPARRQDLLMYYAPDGPVGQVVSRLADDGRIGRVGVVGLGTGNLSCYRRPGQSWTFYEIDPAVVRFARDPRYFDYLSTCAPDAEVVLGDARLMLGRAPAAGFDLLILDAFSSDAIPVHLMTREALALYLEKLDSHGVLLFHVSNRTLDLASVLANLADDAGIAAWSQVQTRDENDVMVRSVAHWIVLARGVEDLPFVDADSRWRRLSAAPGAKPWTDSFSNIVSAIRW